MPTFLVTKNMSPALAARVAASVSGRSNAPRRASRKFPLTAVLRLTTLTLVVASVSAVFYFRRQSAHELENGRNELLRAAFTEGQSLGPADRDVLTRVEAALATHAVATYDGDFIADDLRSEASLTAALQLPTLYIRGPLEALPRSTSLSNLALNSGKDAFVLCALDPPGNRGEKALRTKARAAAANGPSMQVVAHIERLAPLFAGLPFFAPSWAERVKSTEDLTTLQALRKRFEAAPLRSAVRAAKATQLLALMDEQGSGHGPVELDGERPHAVRVILVELATGKLRLRFRREVDPAWISANVRAEYATGIDSCTLAMDLRSAVSKAGEGAVVAAEKTSARR